MNFQAFAWHQKKDTLPAISFEHLLQFIDLTLLNTEASQEDIERLANTASAHHMAAVCIYPQHLALLPAHCSLKRATVLNFPSGQKDHPSVLEELYAIKAPFQELDYVFPYSLYLSGKQKLALDYCREISYYCVERGLCFKVILETGALPSLQLIYQLSCEVLELGCDFLKTSTGKIAQGASIEAAFAMLSALVDTHSAAGLKVSGGIKTFAQAEEYYQLTSYLLNKDLDTHLFRIGASQIPSQAT